MTEQSTSILVSKLAAAQRQIDAAVRMTLAGEDKLAVYTVAAAALKILRDIMQKRGTSLVEDQHVHSIVALARQLIESGTSEVLGYLRDHDRPFYELIEIVADQIRERERDGARVKADDLVKISASRSAEFAYVEKVDFPANFLKHADLDSDGHWDEHGFDSRQVLFDACEAYLSVMRRLTPDMVVYLALFMIEKGAPAESFWRPLAVVARVLDGVDQEERRAFSLDLLKERRNVLSDLLQLYMPKAQPTVLSANKEV